MADRPTSPRLPPVTDADATPEHRELLGGTDAGAAKAANIFTTLVRHSGLARKWLPFAGKLLSGKLPARDRELLILRTGWHCQSVYEWGQHVLIGRAAGISDDEIARVQQGPDASGWDAF